MWRVWLQSLPGFRLEARNNESKLDGQISTNVARNYDQVKVTVAVVLIELSLWHLPHHLVPLVLSMFNAAGADQCEGSLLIQWDLQATSQGNTESASIAAHTVPNFQQTFGAHHYVTPGEISAWVSRLNRYTMRRTN